MYYGFDDFDRTLKIANSHKRPARREDDLLVLSENEKHFIRGTLFGIGVGIGLVLLSMLIMACI